MIASYTKYELQFKTPSATSRTVLYTKTSYILKVNIDDNTAPYYGEAAPLEGLSIDFHESFENMLNEVCKHISYYLQCTHLIRLRYPSIAFALECINEQIQQKNNSILFQSNFTKDNKGIPINGLIWISETDVMIQQIHEKIENGYTTLKLKIGANNFEQEVEVLSWIRSKFSSQNLHIRLDANGAFNTNDWEYKMKRLSKFSIHSIEQPIKPGQFELMKQICKNDIIPVVLDEELINIVTKDEKIELLQYIKPQYIILKPTLHGGISGSEEWIDIANNTNISYWITSALESNIGLNAIAQWTATLPNAYTCIHGLGTGQLYTNNFESPLFIKNGFLYFDSSKSLNIIL